MKWYIFSCSWDNAYKQKTIKAYNLEQAFNFALYYFRGFFDTAIDLDDIKYYGIEKL